MKIYTRTGDDGSTSLFGGTRLRKDAARIEAYGAVDELNAVVGLARAASRDAALNAHLERIQNELFILGSDLATPFDEKNAKPPRVADEHVAWMEPAIDAVEETLEPIRFFILPGGCETAARLHVCRTVCRRAERRVVELAAIETISPTDIRYLNRLSDFLFVLARYANRLEGVADTPWHAGGAP